MTKKWMTAVAFGLMASAVFGQTTGTAHARKTRAPLSHEAAASVKILRDEIKRDKGDMAGKTKAARSERQQILSEEKNELVKLAKSSGTRIEKKASRLAVRKKYAQLLKDARQRTGYQRKNLREDIFAKRDQIKKLRQS